MSTYGAMEESPPAAAPALGPAELKAVRKLLSATSSTNGGSDLCSRTRPQASELVLPRGMRVPPRRRGLPVGVSQAPRDDADLPRASSENFRDGGQGCHGRGKSLSATASCA